MDGAARFRRSAAFLRHLAVQPRFPFRPLEEILRAQTRRLERTVRFAYDRVPYYRAAMDSLGMHPADVRSVEDLTALPLLDGEGLLEQGDAVLAGGRPDPEWLSLHSGGSTNRPKTIYLDRASLLPAVALHARNRILIMGVLGHRVRREAFFAPPFSNFRRNEEVLDELLWIPRRGTVERRYFSLYDDPKAILAELAAFGADHWAGFGSYLAPLFQLLLDGNGSFPTPAVATYSSDDLPESIQRSVEERLGIRIFSLYTAVEATLLGFSCGEGEGMHLNVDVYPVRIVDEAGRTLPHGETGNVVISNLASRATVLLNYQLGDRARFLAEPCPCGRTLPRLAALEGRDDDWVALPGGRRIHSQAVRAVFTFEALRVRAYRVVQEEVDRFTVTIVPAPGVDRGTLDADTVHGFQEALGAATRVEVSFAEEIERTAGGKLRTFFSRVAT